MAGRRRLPNSGEPFGLSWPLDADALEDLRWYLEDYLSAPFGVYGERGPEVQARLADWGAAVFGAVFGSGPARDAYLKLRARSGGMKLVFRSSSPELLGLPWELMRDPGRPTPLALDLAGVSRSLPAAGLADTLPVPGGKLRVLMVISRPAGGRDVGYQMIARPLLRRLAAVRGEVDLVVLRPPTLDALASTLSENGPFQVVHFDGHGVLRREPASEGMLEFEQPDGSVDDVPASKIAQVLRQAEVPVVVLNACQSGAIGQDLGAAVATRLLQEGIASVVAMAYSVYAVAAAEFMAAFYERLFAGDPVSAAVAAGRRRMFTRDRRPSPKGDLPLADWLVPVHYLRRDVSFPQARTERSDMPSLEETLDQIRAANGGDGRADLDPVGVFTGRDALFYELEAAARLQRVVVLHGPGGTGKTELAKAFGRWWRDTGGVERPEWVFFHSFEPGLATFGLDGVVNEIGRRVFGTEFDQLEPAGRRATMERVLSGHRMLLIWDNFESVYSMPAAETTVPDDLKDFLARMAARGRSAVLITSRSPETWLGELRRIPVGGLTPREADEYAEHLLSPYPAARPRRAVRAFGEVLEWLDGHPLSMRLILPHLDTTEPSALLDALQGAAPMPGEGEDGGRLTSLPASIAYSYAHLSEQARRLLPAVSLFHGVADEHVLMLFSGMSGVPERFAGTTREVWHGVLEEAAGVGLLTSLGSMYGIHPALPAYLAARWRQKEPDGHETGRESAVNALVAAYADFGRWLDEQIASGDAGLAFSLIDFERRTMGHVLGSALGRELWDRAMSILLPLASYWHARGLTAEADAWIDRVLLATEHSDGTAPQAGTSAGGLWWLAAGARANRQLVRLRLDDAEQTYNQMRAALEAQPPSRLQRQGLAMAYHQLGLVAEQRGELGEAKAWYRRALTIDGELGDRQGMAGSYYQLGMVAEQRGELGEAEGWTRRALAIAEELGDRPGMAMTYYQLGMVTRDRGRLAEAAEWCRKSLAIEEELGDRRGMALTFVVLGQVAEQRGEVGRALEWTVRCVAVFDEFPHPLTGPGPEQLARLTTDLGVPVLEETWARVTGAVLPDAVREYVRSQREQPRSL